ncbi:RING-finger-containing ubiquitin ligase [Pyrenophora tritici-repentis]|nr:RING-finger-containing ubiquitin ligase [Pyrenophora tritici-repentis]KAF7450506.1 RING-finger-containing ubiquitin ligase [Pyrenophora tritici-repentis]KAI0584213.1 RING-finger-containing ubiquitin ligase [Pyrenophora tritici-repentis]KAI2480427.1 RING-finger-containing ubiquitin ligase [Pyrenophora tritici-repentis]
MSNFGPFRNPALGGGEEVRVCNPCVPDPNFSPPPQYDTPARASRYPGQFPPTARSPYISRPQPPPHPRAHRSASSVQGTSQFAGQAQIHGGRDPSNDQSRRGPNNDDTERTQHIQECIALHSASPGPTAALAQVTSASLPNQRTRGMSSAGNGEGASNQSRMSHAARGMFPYVATEKDCIDDEGRQAECTICLEDFEAGDKMARLVCWCKFHESCIKEWWDKKGRGACPTHQLQE